jgi:transposase-like protein
MDASCKEKAEQLATEFASGATSIGELNALLRIMMKRGLETMLDSEMEHHLESKRHLGSEDAASSQ